MLTECGTSLSYIEKETILAYLVSDLLYASDKLRSEHENIDLSKIKAILYLIRSISEVERNCKSSGFKNPEIYRKPFKAVHQEYADLIPFFYTSFKKKICKTVCLFVKYLPGYLTAVKAYGVRFNEVIVSPCLASYLSDLGIYLYKSDIISIKLRISFK